MSKRIALLSRRRPWARWHLAPSSSRPSAAQDKMTSRREDRDGRRRPAMFPPRRTSSRMAVNSKDHTTLVAAVKAAGLVEDPGKQGPVHRVRADQRRLRQACRPARSTHPG